MGAGTHCQSEGLVQRDVARVHGRIRVLQSCKWRTVSLKVERTWRRSYLLGPSIGNGPRARARMRA
jgi:hypothetical protein